MTRLSASASARTHRSDSKRRSILAGACKAFLAEGFGNVSMDLVAATARVSKMTLYRYFGSKEKLFAGVVGDMCNHIIDSDVAATMNKLAPRKALEFFGRRMMEIVFAPETLGLHRVVVSESTRFPDLGRLFYDSGPGASVVMLAAYFRQNRGHPELNISDPRKAAEGFMTLLRGYEHMRALLNTKPALSQRAAEECLQRALRYVLRPAGSADTVRYRNKLK